MGCQLDELVTTFLSAAASLKHRVSVTNDGGASRGLGSRLGLKGAESLLGVDQDGEIRIGILPKMQKALVSFAGGTEIFLLLAQQAEAIMKLNHVRGRVSFRL